MRIAAKRLRYTMEICNPAFDRGLNDSIKAVKRLQSLLGDIHDCDVWAEQVTDFVANERRKTLDYFGHDRPFRVLQPGLIYLQENRQAQRESLFAQLTDLWQAFREEGVWEQLRVAIGAVVAVNEAPPTIITTESLDVPDASRVDC